jgi:hypothetical protein
VVTANSSKTWNAHHPQLQWAANPRSVGACCV